MTTETKTTFKRNILRDDATETATELLQKNLVNLIDLALLLKQAHWNVVGANFRSLHLQLDDVIASVRDASDSVAERSSTLGVAPEGSSTTVSRQSVLTDYPSGFLSVGETLSHVADALNETIEHLRRAIDTLGDVDPVTEDLCIGIAATLEKHLWMLQSQEL